MSDEVVENTDAVFDEASGVDQFVEDYDPYSGSQIFEGWYDEQWYPEDEY